MRPAGGTGPPPRCDAHFHVFGPAATYPVLAGTTADPGATLDDYLAVAGPLGIGRHVLVQPSAYGADNRCLLAALGRLGPTRARGVVVVGDDRPDDATLEAWHGLGVRGLRVIGFPPGTAAHRAGRPPAGAGADDWPEALRPALVRQIAMAGELGWHVDLLVPGWVLASLLDVLEAAAPVPLVMAHLAMFPAEGGDRQPGLREVVRLASEGTRHGWLKLTAPYRLGPPEHHGLVGDLARSCVAAAPDRVVWGSDYPHLSFAGSVDTAGQLGQVDGWFPESPVREAILGGNAAVLYGFEEGAPR